MQSFEVVEAEKLKTMFKVINSSTLFNRAGSEQIAQQTVPKLTGQNVAPQSKAANVRNCVEGIVGSDWTDCANVAGTQWTLDLHVWK